MKLEIWNDKHGERIEIGEDRDGLGLTEIRQIDSQGKMLARITLDDDALSLTIKALERFQKWKQENEGQK